jgi:YegS/Rv2252/BmrU family lipid kinase
MSPLPLIIVNPASAGGVTGAAWPGTASEVRRHFGPFEVAFTKRGGEAVEIAEREARAGRRFLIACGGDGTVNEVANGILRAGAPSELGVLPSGTGGDFRRTIRMPLRTADAALALREGLTRAIDAGRVTFKSDRRQLTDGGRELKSGGRELTNDGGELVSGSGELTGGGAEEETRFFLNVASFGMGGEVIRRVKERAGLPAGASRVLGGRLSFALAAIQSTLAFEKPAVRVALDGHAESQLTVTNFCVANARYFGGGMKIAPTALLDDGLFDVVAVGDLSALKVLANSYRVYLGTHLGMRQVQHARARLVTARPTGSEEVKLEIDGELAGRLPATFEILPGALRVRCPK